MEIIKIKSTTETPEIYFNPQGNLSLKGISIPHNVNTFYQPLFDWLEKYKNSNPKNVKLELFLDYLNTSSTRVIVDLLKLIDSFRDNGTQVNIVWIYDKDDEDMLELGEDFELVTNASFVYQTAVA